VLSGPARERIENSVITKLIVSNTIALDDVWFKNGRVVQLSVAPLLAEGIMRIAMGQSVSSLFV
jgi:ribose-phosphate pyrophosphokinase